VNGVLGRLQDAVKSTAAFAAPALNLIGEHTDYTGGLVMPMAIGFHTVAVVSARQDGRAVLIGLVIPEPNEMLVFGQI
jgi:galactokinase